MDCSNSACVDYAILSYFYIYISMCMYCMRFNCLGGFVLSLLYSHSASCILFAYRKKLFQSSDWKQVEIRTLHSRV